MTVKLIVKRGQWAVSLRYSANSISEFRKSK